MSAQNIYNYAEEGNKEALSELIASGAVEVNQQDQNNRSLLHYASIGGFTDIVSMLLEAGANVNVTTGRGATPLHYAARSGKSECVPLLLDHGAEVNCRDNHGSTPLMTSIQQGQFKTTSLLLCNYNADPNIPNKDMISPLTYAIEKGAPLKTIQLLIQKGANITARSQKTGDTPLSSLRFSKPAPIESKSEVPMNEDISKLYYVVDDRLLGDAGSTNSSEIVSSNKYFTDVTFLVEGHKVHSHKCIISARCPSFIPTLHSSSSTIDLKSISYQNFISVMEWVYKNKITGLEESPNVKDLTSLLLASERFGNKKLMEECEAILVGRLSATTISLVWEEIMKSEYVRFNCPALIKHCSYYILTNWNSICSIKPFSGMSGADVCQLFDYVSVSEGTATISAPSAKEKSSSTPSKSSSSTPATPSTSNGKTPSKSAASSTPSTPSTPSVAKSTDPMDEKNKAHCKQVWTNIHKNKQAHFFYHPVDPIGMGIPEYPNIIKHPMDMSTIKQKLESNQYKTPSDFGADMRLMFDNATTFNADGSVVFKVAKQLLLNFNKKFESIYINEVVPPTPAVNTTTTTPTPAVSTASVNSTPVSKSKSSSSTPSSESKKRKTAEPITSVSIKSNSISKESKENSTPSTSVTTTPVKSEAPHPEPKPEPKEETSTEAMQVENGPSTTENHENNSTASTSSSNNNNGALRTYTDEEKKSIMESIYTLELDDIKYIFGIVDESAVKQIGENLELDIAGLSDANLVEIEEYLRACQKRIKLDQTNQEQQPPQDNSMETESTAENH